MMRINLLTRGPGIGFTGEQCTGAVAVLNNNFYFAGY